MNEQQLAAVKQALEALESGDGWRQSDAITALQSIISQDALDKMAENARELGLSYEPAPVQVGTIGHIGEGKTTLTAAIRPVIAPAAQSAPDIADIIAGELKVSRGTAYDMMREVLAEEFPPDPCCASGTSCNAPKPWVGLTDEERLTEGLRKPFWEDAARAIEAILKEKNT